MPPTNRLRKVGLCNTALVYLGVVLILIFPIRQVGSNVTETSVAADELIRIEPGSSVRREIAAGGKDVFGVSVDQGKLLRFSIDKGDLALSTVLYGPTGTKLLEHISQDFEVVELSFPAEVWGMYRLELSSRESTQPASHYELRVQSLITVTPLSRKDSEARQAMADGEVLRAKWTQASLRDAIEKFQKAALIWISASDSSNASKATLKTGDIYFLLSEYPDALKQYRKAVELAAKTPDQVAEATALSKLGLVYSYMGDNDRADQYLNNALNLLPHGEADATTLERNAIGETISNLGEVIYAKGNLPKAATEFERAGEFLSGNRKGEARVHLFAGYIAGSIGDHTKALAETSKALELARSTNDKQIEGLALVSLGLSHSFNREEDRAIELHQPAIEIFRQIGDRHSEAIALTAVGQSYENLHDYSTALDKYEKALRLYEDIGALDLLPVPTFKVAKTYRQNGNLHQALAYINRCLSLSRAGKKLRTEINALNELANIYEAQKRPEQSLNQYRKIEQFYQSTGDRRGEALALNSHGDFLRRIGEKNQALETYQKALSLSQEVGDKGILIATLYNLALAYRNLDQYEVALSFVQRSLKTIEELRTNVASPELRTSYFSGVRKHYELCIEILMQMDRVRHGQGFATEALLVSEKSRARSLIDLLSESHADWRQGATPELLSREREVRGYLRLLAKYEMDLSLNKNGTVELTEVAKQSAQLRSEYQQIQAQLRRQNPRLLSLERSASLSLEQIQNELRNPDTLLLEYSLGDERSYLWAVTSNSFHSYVLPARKDIEDPAKEVYKLLIARQGWEGQSESKYQANVDAADRLLSEKSKSLSQMLLGPVADQLGTRELLFVKEGALQYVPFEALPAPTTPGSTDVENRAQRYLVETNEISESPSISTLIAIRAEKHRPFSPDRIVAVVADPVFSRTDDRVQSAGLSPAVASAASHQDASQSAQLTFRNLRDSGPARLTHASEEADAISAAAPRGTTMIAKGFDATCETAMSPEVGRYQIVHFATHGFLDSERPELSSIVLSMVDRNGAERNGLMPLHDIYNLDLSAELTVLSACQTALGKDVKGEGLVGLTHSFMSAGSKSVVASLWKVDDRATAVLMAEFYDSMLQKGMPTAAALRAAKLKMKQDKRWSAPYYWAGFVLQGEYANRIAVARNSWLRVGSGLLLLLIATSCGLIVFQRRRRRSPANH